jgi:hypothetical protein
VGVVGRALAYLVEIGSGILLVVAIAALTLWVAEDGGVLIFLAMCPIGVAWMIIDAKVHDYAREHDLRMGPRILVHLGLILLSAALLYPVVAWATKPSAVISGMLVGFLVWSLGMSLSSIRETVRRRTGKQVH